jgi:type VI secretion system protein ImpJ
MRRNDFTHITPIIQWHEGMMLSPQHFQQNDLRFHQILRHQIETLSYYYWGVHHLKLDPIVLPDGLIRVLELEAVMPDGLIVQYSADKKGSLPLEIDLKSYKQEINQPIPVMLALPELLSSASLVQGELPRYVSVEGEETKDSNTADNPLRIPRLLPKLFLTIGDTPPPRCVAFPLVKVAFSDEVFVNTNYLAPCFFVEKNTPLWQQLAELVQKIREKATYLCEKLQNQTGTPMLQETASLLRSLIGGLPGFEVMVHGDPIHPYRLYLKLCDMVGHLAALRLSQVPPVLPPYQHNDMVSCFSMVLELLNKYIQSIDVSFAAIPFNQKDRLFYLRMENAYLEEKLYLGVRAPRGMMEAQVEEWANDAIIACDSAVELVRERRITGAERAILENEDLYDLMPSRGVVVFQIKPSPEFVQAGQNLNIFNPADTLERRPLEVTLYVRKKSEETLL